MTIKKDENNVNYKTVDGYFLPVNPGLHQISFVHIAHIRFSEQRIIEA